MINLAVFQRWTQTEDKTSLFADDTPSTFSQVAGCISNIQMLVGFLYANNELDQKTILVIIASWEFLGTNLTKGKTSTMKTLKPHR